MKVLFLGTSSGAGKTTLCALYCRYLSKKGIKVAPFKASNLSLNSYVTKNEEEIGMGQAFQAWAAGIQPTGNMNPVLLKPSGGGVMQVILNGKPFMDTTKDKPMDREYVLGKVCESFDSLENEYDAVICEGSGSPAEINLQKTDLANVGLMRAKNVPSILVADIERGGVFAAIYGTWRLIPDDLKPLMKGFIINRFRGDASILKEGFEKVEELTGMKCLGVLPYMSLKFPEEDSLSDSQGKLEGSDMMTAYMSNLDELLEHSKRMGFDFDMIEKIVE